MGDNQRCRERSVLPDDWENCIIVKNGTRIHTFYFPIKTNQYLKSIENRDNDYLKKINRDKNYLKKIICYLPLLNKVIQCVVSMDFTNHHLEKETIYFVNSFCNSKLRVLFAVTLYSVKQSARADERNPRPRA